MTFRFSFGYAVYFLGSLSLLFNPPAAKSFQSPGTDQPLAIESRSVVFTYPLVDPYDLANQYGFNHAPSVATLPDGRLLCVWFSGPFEASVHQVILAAISSDQGRTWERAYVIQDQPRSSDFDPALIVDGKRTWFFYIYGRWNRYPFAQSKAGEEKDYIGKESYHLYARYSDDSGKTWSEERQLHETAGSRTNGIRLTSGELLLPVHDFVNTKECSVLRSVDNGKTWSRGGTILNPAGVDEPTIAELQNGDVLMALRTYDDRLWTCVSKDKGVTWSKPKQHDMLAAGASHNLLRMSDGRVVLTHNENTRDRRSPLTLRVTRDGETWTKPLTIAEAPSPGVENDYWAAQVTYPSVCEVPGKTLVVVWTKINMSNLEQFGEIHSARIRILD